MKKPIRVLCVDDHSLVVDGLRARLDVEPDIEVIGHLSTADHLVDEARRVEADIVLLDVEMPGIDAFTAADELRRRYPQTRTILLSAHVRDRYLDRAYETGMWGYLTKSDKPEVLIEGIRKVNRGDLAFSPEVAARSVPAAEKPGARTKRPPSRRHLLTDREQQILCLVAKGFSRTEIAKQLCRSPMTVDNHRKAIMKKLGVRDRVELTHYAIAEGFVEVAPRRPSDPHTAEK